MIDKNIENKHKNLGKVVWLWSMSPLHKEWPISAAANYIIPAIDHKQYFILEDKHGLKGYVSWAFLDKDREKKYISNPNSLEYNDWNCGDRLWFTDFVAPFSKKDVLKIRRKMSEIHGKSFFARSIKIDSETKKARVVEYTSGSSDQDKTKLIREEYFNDIKKMFLKDLIRYR